MFLKETDQIFVTVYVSFFLDNVLLTVVVPIIPDFLFSKTIEFNRNSSNFPYGPSSLSQLQRKFGNLDDESRLLGILLSSKAFVQLFSTPIVGFFMVKIGCLSVMLIGSCNIFISTLIFTYGNSYGLLVTARALHGISSAATSVSGMSLLAENVPPNLRQKLMPVAFGGIALGVLIGYPFGGIFYQNYGKEAPFLLISLCILLNMALQISMVRDETGKSSTEQKHSEICNFLNEKRTVIATSAIFVSTTVMSVLEPCVPLWLLGHFHPTPPKWQLGAVFIPDSVGYFFGSHFGGFIPMETWRTTLTAMLIGGLSACAIPLADSITQLFIPHFGIGLSVGIVDATLVPYLATIVDETNGGSKYSSMYALQQVAVSLAYSFGPLIAGETVHLIGFVWMMRFVGFLNIAFLPILIELEDQGGHLEYSKTESGMLPLIGMTRPAYSSLENERN